MLERSLPLFDRELSEQAARPRTYVLRVAYGVALFAVVLGAGTALFSQDSEGAAAIALLRGEGGQLFRAAYWAQVAGIFLVAPALMASAFVHERQQGTLDLLVLTGSPLRAIVVGKFLSRLMPLLTFLVLGLPIFALSLSYGGVSEGAVWSASWRLVLTACEVGAIALWRSVRASSVVQALVRAYATLWGVSLLAIGVEWLSRAVFHAVLGWDTFESFRSLITIPFLVALDQMLSPGFSDVAVIIFALAITALCLRRATQELKRLIASGPIHGTGSLETTFRVAGERWRRGPRVLPVDDPVAWREKTGAVVAQVWKLIAWPLALGLSCFAYLRLVLDWREWSGEAVFFSVTIGISLFVGAAIQGMLAASTFQSERTTGTLEALVATPIPSREIVRQKLAPLRSLATFWAALGAWLAVHEAAVEFSTERDGDETSQLSYLSVWALFLPLYLWTAKWMGAWIGLRVRDRSRAVVIVPAILVAWIGILPPAIDALLRSLDVGPLPGVSPLSLLRLLSPWALFELAEFNAWGRSVWGTASLSVALHGSLILGIAGTCRWLVFANADRLLGRVRAKPRVPPT